MCSCLSHGHYGDLAATQAGALTGNRTGDTLVYRPALNPLSHTSQGHILYFRQIEGCVSVLLFLAKLSHEALAPGQVFVSSGGCLWKALLPSDELLKLPEGRKDAGIGSTL